MTPAFVISSSLSSKFLNDDGNEMIMGKEISELLLDEFRILIVAVA